MSKRLYEDLKDLISFGHADFDLKNIEQIADYHGWTPEAVASEFKEMLNTNNTKLASEIKQRIAQLEQKGY